MPLFVCDICGVVENTALGHYWSKSFDCWSDKTLTNKALCSECMPMEFSDGSINRRGGKWHNEFPKEYIGDLSKEKIERYNLLNYDKKE